jgi:DNA-nicking Smr family endonuclease
MDPEPDWEVDLHRLSPEMALRKLAQELHACRMRRMQSLLVITGRGWGNREQKPVLRPKVEAWLRGDEGRRLGVVGFETTSRGGALLVRLRQGSDP